MCHILASELALYRHGSYMYYTFYIARLAQDFSKRLYDAHDWLRSWEARPSLGSRREALDLIIPLDQVPTYTKRRFRGV